MRARDYIDQVMQYLEADETVKARLRQDLMEHIQDAGDDAIYRMGSPKELAAELMDTLYSDKSDVVRELVRARAELRRYNNYEYISKARLFGLPLVHIRFSRHRPLKPAKGILAIGLASAGVISIGVFSFGILSIGALSLGLLSIGAIAAGGFALGGVALGLMALGGLSIGLYALGGAAFAARVAIGGWASGTVAIGGTAEGIYTIATGGTTLDVSAVSRQEAQDLIRQAYPDIPDFVLRFLTSIFR